MILDYACDGGLLTHIRGMLGGEPKAIERYKTLYALHTDWWHSLRPLVALKFGPVCLGCHACTYHLDTEMRCPNCWHNSSTWHRSREYCDICNHKYTKNDCIFFIFDKKYYSACSHKCLAKRKDYCIRCRCLGTDVEYTDSGLAIFGECSQCRSKT